MKFLSCTNHELEQTMKYLNLLLTISLSTLSSLAICEEIVIDTPMAATSLKFADRNASVFYTVDKDIYKVVVAFSTGTEDNEQLIRQSFQLADRQSYNLSIGGYGANEQASTINLKRKDDLILAEVITCESRDRMVNCI
ncbi:MAG: hypothetical protein ABW170_15035 [Candidatus Thiodiazotropha sp. L084R]